MQNWRKSPALSSWIMQKVQQCRPLVVREEHSSIRSHPKRWKIQYIFISSMGVVNVNIMSVFKYIFNCYFVNKLINTIKHYVSPIPPWSESCEYYSALVQMKYQISVCLSGSLSLRIQTVLRINYAQTLSLICMSKWVRRSETVSQWINEVILISDYVTVFMLMWRCLYMESIFSIIDQDESQKNLSRYYSK